MFIPFWYEMVFDVVKASAGMQALMRQCVDEPYTEVWKIKSDCLETIKLHRKREKVPV